MNPTYKIIAAVVMLLLSAYLGHWITDNHWQAKWSAHESADAKANEKAAVEMLTKQQKLSQELEHAYKTAETLTRQHKVNVANAADSERRLREEIERIKAMPAATHTSTIASRANAATDSRVLAELFRQSDYLAGRYAESAGSHQVALSACIAEYDAVRRSVGVAR